MAVKFEATDYKKITLDEMMDFIGYDVRTAFCCARRHTPEYALYRSVKDSGIKF
jgi:hypothetical protein